MILNKKNGLVTRVFILNNFFIIGNLLDLNPDGTFHMKRHNILVSLRACLVFLFVASMGSVMNMFNHIFLIMSSIVAILLIVIDHYRVLKVASFFLLLSVLFLVFSSRITNTDFFLYRNFVVNIFIVTTLLISYHDDMTDLKEDIAKSCYIICILGVMNVLLYTFLPGIFTYVVNDVGYSVESLAYIFNYSSQDRLIIPRNQGLYWEPGVFQIVINIYLYYNLIEKKSSLRSSVIPVLLVFSTQSTTGLVIMLILFFYRIKDNHGKNLKLIRIFLILFVVCMSPIIMNNIYEKLFGELSGSSQMRFYDYWMGLEVIKNYPITGIGVDPDKYLRLSDAVEIPIFDTGVISVERGNTNSIINIGVCFGIPIMILYVIALYKQRIFCHKKIFFILLLLGIMSEPLYSSMFIFLIVISSINFNQNLSISKYEKNWNRHSIV